MKGGSLLKGELGRVGGRGSLVFFGSHIEIREVEVGEWSSKALMDYLTTASYRFNYGLVISKK